MKKDKLKKLTSLNHEIPITTPMLKSMGISSFLARKYKESGWIESIGTGAFKFPTSDITLEGTLHALQQDLNLMIYTGAKTALEMGGIRQYYREKEKIYFYSEKKTYLPHWVQNILNNRVIKHIKSEKWNQNQYLYSPKTKSFDFFIATKELAIIQQIELINRSESFAETAELFEILTGLNAEYINAILKFSSKKTRRIFNFLLEHFKPTWKKDIDPDNLKTGNAIIMATKGNGKYIKEHHLIIPRDFHV